MRCALQHVRYSGDQHGTHARYPDPAQKEVREAIASANGLTGECVYAGNGASEIIAAITSMTAPKKALLIEPCYSGYEHALGPWQGCDVKRAFLS